MVDTRIEKYRAEYEKQWDQFIQEKSVNGTFLQERRFLNYHREDRFKDCSLLFFDKTNLIAVCPACEVLQDGKKTFYSHKGSTYGGIVLEKEMLRVDKFRCIYDAFEAYLKQQGFQECILKLTMDLLCQYPQELIKFYLSYAGYKEIKELNVYIDYRKYNNDVLSNFSKMKKRNVRKCIEAGMQLRELQSEKEIERFHHVLSKNLQKYDTVPVHTVSEMIDLKKRLGEGVIFYGAYMGELLVAGTMVFVFEKVRCAHTQYLAADPDYANVNAMSFIYYKMIEIYMEKGFRYLSWGTTTEHGGEEINWNLANNKEEFGSLHSVNSIFEKSVADIEQKI